MSTRTVGSIPWSRIEEVPTPSLVVDLEAVDFNIRMASNLLVASNARLRPHFKAHKCTRLLHRQTSDNDTRGVTCQTAAEAVVLADSGFGDILVASHVADRWGLNQLATAAASAKITAVVDALEHVHMLSETASQNGVDFRILIELDVGLGRGGLPPDSANLLQLADAIHPDPRLTLTGLQAYEGHVVLSKDPKLRQTLLWQVARQIEHERRRLFRSGFDVSVVSGGGTGTMELAAEMGALTEIQAGSYVLMDSEYASLDLPFRTALYCVGTVVTARGVKAAVANVGLKSLTTEHGLPTSISPEVSVVALSDEHALLTVARDNGMRIGERIVLIPSHVDPTINLHEALYVWNGRTMEPWAVDGRRSSTFRLTDTAESI